MNELRWVLLIVGIAVVAAIYVFGRKEQLRRRRYRRDEETTEDTADLSFNMRPDEDDPAPAPAHLDELSQTLTEDTGWHAPSPVIPLSPRPVERASAPKPSSPQSHTREAIVRRPLAGDKIISFYIVARRPDILRGEAIRRAVEDADLEYGEMHIFNKVIKRNGQRHIVFSLANAVRSGTFDLDKLRHFTTPGLVLFMQLPGPMEGLKALNLMLDCAQRLAGDLDAELLDDSRTVLSDQTIDHMREEVQLFSLRTARARNRVP